MEKVHIPNMYIARDVETGEEMRIDFSVFETVCPECGSFHEIDLIDLIRNDPDFTFSDTRVLCPECTARRRGERADETE